MSFHIEFKMTIPNALSFFRILLVPLFAVLYLLSEQTPVLMYWSFGVLLLSGATDLFDGMIARRFNQISELGKLLDPVADKLTQVTVVLCLAIRHTYLVPLLVLCVVKEAAQAVGGLLLLRQGEKIQGARWFGKVSTFAFYGVMALIVLVPDMPRAATVILVGLVAVTMLFAFINYIRMYIQIHNAPGSSGNAAPDERPADCPSENGTSKTA